MMSSTPPAQPPIVLRTPRQGKPILLALALLWVLAACATPMRTVDERESDVRQQWFDKHPSWAVSGRLGLSDGERGGQLAFRWVAEGDQHQIDLSTSTGGQRWQLVYGPQWAELSGSDMAYHAGPNPDALVEAALGWPVPVRALSYWVRDLPAPPALDADRAQWALSVQRYMETEPGVLMPSRLQAERPPHRVRLALRDWKLPAKN